MFLTAQIQKERFTYFLKILFFIFYILWVAVGIIHHEAWRDEGQAWLIARDLSWVQIFLNTGVEGHPFLWSYILKPFTSLPFYPTLPMINAFFVFLGVFFLLFRLKLPFWFAIPFIIFSPLFYEIPIIARSYGCAFFLSVLVGLFYEERFQKPLRYSLVLGLLMNITVVGAVVGAILLLYFYYEVIDMKNKNIVTMDYPLYQKSLILGLSFLGLIGLQLGMMLIARGQRVLSFLQTIPLWTIPIAVLLIIGCIFLFYKRLWKNPSQSPINNSTKLILQVVLFSIFLVVHFIFRYALFSRITFGIGICFLFFKKHPLKEVFVLIYISIIIGSLFYYLPSRQILSFSFLIIFIISKILENTPDLRYLYLGIVIVATFNSFYYNSIELYSKDFHNDYSGAKKAAQYIKDNQWDNKEEFLLVAHNSAPNVGAIAPFFDEKIFYFPYIKTYGSVLDWVRYSDRASLQVDKIESENKDKTVIYLEKGPELSGYTWNHLTNFSGMEGIDEVDGVDEIIDFYRLEKNNEK